MTVGKLVASSSFGGEGLDLLLGEEGVEDLLDEGLVVVGEAIDLLKHAEELAVLEVGAGGVLGITLEQVVGRDAEHVGEALEGGGGGEGAAALVAADVGVVKLDQLTELGLGEALGLAQLAEAGSEVVRIRSFCSTNVTHLGEG